MKIAAIISEYNPFHKGHAYQIEKTREATGATHIIALMSGNFVQRGLPAIIDKYRRAEMALLGGARSRSGTSGGVCAILCGIFRRRFRQDSQQPSWRRSSVLWIRRR